MDAAPPFPSDPAQATRLLHGVLLDLIQGPTSGDDGPIPREAALEAFRRHLSRVQGHVRDTFDQGHLHGLKAARLLAGYVDGLMGELFNYACGTSAATGARPPGR